MSTALITNEMLMEDALEAARRQGEQHGESAAAWVFDGSTDQAAYQAAADGLDAGDPATYDRLGQNEPRFSDAFSTRNLCDDIGVDYALSTTAAVDQIADTYLEAARDAYWAEVARVARAQLTPDDMADSMELARIESSACER